MLKLGHRLAAAARERGVLHADASVWFGTNLSEADFGPKRGDWTIVVASYLFASPSLNVQKLMVEILGAIDCVGPGPAAVLYTNSAQERWNLSYPEFRDRLVDAGFGVVADDTAELAGDRGSRTLRYALLFRPETRTIDLGTPEP
jgi:hypothetical protein